MEKKTFCHAYLFFVYFTRLVPSCGLIWTMFSPAIQANFES